jgi:hypothetical protein
MTVVSISTYCALSSATKRKSFITLTPGLGYHIKADKTQDKLGKIPMRRLVYRVKEIPASMFPLVWDFGTLDDDTEKKYIIQMIASQVAQNKLNRLEKDKLLEVLCRFDGVIKLFFINEAATK